ALATGTVAAYSFGDDLAARSSRPSLRALAAPSLLVAVAALPAIAFARALFSGAQASKLPFHGALVGLTALLLLGGLHVSALLVAAIARRPPRRAAWLALALVVCGAGLAATNQLVLPNLYPGAHALLALATFGAFATASLCLGSRISGALARV